MIEEYQELVTKYMELTDKYVELSFKYNDLMDKYIGAKYPIIMPPITWPPPYTGDPITTCNTNPEEKNYGEF